MKGLPKKNRRYVWVALGVCGLRCLGWAERVGQRRPEKHLNEKQKNDDVSVALDRLPRIFHPFWRLYKTEARSDPLLLKVGSIRIVLSRFRVNCAIFRRGPGVQRLLKNLSRS